MTKAEAWQELRRRYENWKKQVQSEDLVPFEDCLEQMVGTEIGGWKVSYDFMCSIILKRSTMTYRATKKKGKLGLLKFR